MLSTAHRPGLAKGCTALVIAALFAVTAGALHAEGDLLIEVQGPEGSPVASASLVVAMPGPDGRGAVYAWHSVWNGRASVPRSDRQGYVSIYEPKGRDGRRLSLMPSEGVLIPADASTLTIRMKPGHELSGRVVGPDEKPLANVQVSAHSMRSSEARRVPGSQKHAQGTTDGTGGFMLRGLALDRYELRLSLHGTPLPCSPRVVTAGTKNVVLTTLSSRSVRIRVLDTNDAPINGARVVIYYAHEGKGPWTPPQGTTYAGAVVIRGLPTKARGVRLSVSPPRHRDDLAAVERSPWKLADDVITLGPGWTLEGRVVDAKGRGVKAMVHIARPNGRVSQSTDGAGRFVQRGLPMRAASVAAVPQDADDGMGVGPPGFAEDWFKYEVIEPTDSVTEVRLQRPTPAEQTMLEVLGPDGRPISSAHVDLSFAPAPGSLVGRGSTIDRAQLTLPKCDSPIAIMFTDVKDADGKPVGLRFQRTLLSVGRTKHTVRLETPKVLTGRVLAPDGAPARGATVRATGIGLDVPLRGDLLALTDEEGRFRMEGLASDIYTLIVTPMPPHVAPAAVFAGPDLTNEIEIRLPAPLVLRILDPAEAPVDGARVIAARPHDRYGSIGSDEPPGPLTDENGIVRVAPPGEGDWLRVLPPGSRADLGPAGPFRPDRGTSTIRLPHNRRLDVHVSLDDSPWRGAMILWRTPESFPALVLQRDWIPESDVIRSGSDGRVTWRRAPAGPFQVRAVSVPLEENTQLPLGSWSPWVNVGADDKDIVIAAAKAVVGEIRVPGAKPGQICRIAVEGPGFPMGVELAIGRDGTAPVSLSPAGSYTAIVRGLGGDPARCAYGKGVTFTDGVLTLPVAETHFARLRLEVPEGAPEPHEVLVMNPWVTLMNPWDHFSCTRESAGVWRTPDLPAGRWEVRAFGRWRSMEISLGAKVRITLPAKDVLSIPLTPRR